MFWFNERKYSVEVWRLSNMNGKYLTLIGTALTLALTSNVALAQSSKFETAQSGGQPSGESTRSPGEVKLSPRVDRKKFCTDFPLNSRCQGEAASTPSSSGSSSDTQKQPADGSAIPGKGPADTGTTGNPDGSIDVAPPPGGNPSVPGSGTQQQTLPGGAGDTQTTPSGGTTGAPDSNPGGTAVPGTAPADPGTTGNPGGSTELAPPPVGNPANPGNSSDPTAPGSSTTDPTLSPSQGGSGSGTTPNSGGSR